MRASAFALAAVLLAGGCATPRPFLTPLLKEARSDSLGHYVGSRRIKGSAVIESGSAARGSQDFDPEAADACRSAARGGAAVSVCARDPISDETLDFWIGDFAGALDALNTTVFGDGPLFKLDVTIYAAGPSERISFTRRAPVTDNRISLAFVTRTTLLKEPFRRVVSQSFAHESHHAITRARRLLAGGAPRMSGTTETILEEGAAELYGLCGALLAANLASRAESNHEFGGGRGGVLPDASLRSLLAGDYEALRPALSRLEIDRAAEMLATTIWSGAIGARYIAAADRDEGRAILALCTKDNLATPEGFAVLLEKLGEDGADAEPLEPFEGAVRDAYFAEYRAAIARWRDAHGVTAPKAAGS